MTAVQSRLQLSPEHESGARGDILIENVCILSRKQLKNVSIFQKHFRPEHKCYKILSFQIFLAEKGDFPLHSEHNILA